MLSIPNINELVQSLWSICCLFVLQISVYADCNQIQAKLWIAVMRSEAKGELIFGEDCFEKNTFQNG